jgi:hypothetical protein
MSDHDLALYSQINNNNTHKHHSIWWTADWEYDTKCDASFLLILKYNFRKHFIVIICVIYLCYL